MARVNYIRVVPLLPAVTHDSGAVHRDTTGGPIVPMVELTTTKGALDEDAKQRLAGELSIARSARR
jgi:hypothetical protein